MAARWLAPAALCVLSAACVGKYASEPAIEQSSAASIAKDKRYSIMQALTPGGGNRPVSGLFYYLNSPLGSTAVMLDSSGEALLRLEYFPNGTVNQAASRGDYVADHTFGQKEYDKELEAYYNAVRYYDAETMRFTTPDAIKDSGDFLVHNAYAYTRNNPVNYIDPSGFATMRHDGGGSGPPIGSRVGPGGARQIDGPTGPRAAPRVRQSYIPTRRPVNPVRTDRFNRGPDGGQQLRTLPRKIAVPWRDHNPADSVRGYGGYYLLRRVVIPWRDYNPVDGSSGYAGVGDRYAEELRVDRVFHHINWGGPGAYHEGRPLTDAEKRLYAPYIPESVLADARVRSWTPLWFVSGHEAITIGNHIHIRPGAYDPNHINGIVLLGHELKHVAQYHEGMGLNDYLGASARAGYEMHKGYFHTYVGTYNPVKGYDNNRYEVSAYDLSDQIRRDLCPGRPGC